MNNSKEQKQDVTRIQVGNLPEQEKELQSKEAESVKGGGGPSGGVLQPSACAGEEIPQTTRR